MKIVAFAKWYVIDYTISWKPDTSYHVFKNNPEVEKNHSGLFLNK